MSCLQNIFYTIFWTQSRVIVRDRLLFKSISDPYFLLFSSIIDVIEKGLAKLMCSCRIRHALFISQAIKTVNICFVIVYFIICYVKRLLLFYCSPKAI